MRPVFTWSLTLILVFSAALDAQFKKRPSSCMSPKQAHAFRVLAMEQMQALATDPGKDCGSPYGQIQSDARSFLPLLGTDPIAAMVFKPRERKALVEKFCGPHQKTSTEQNLLASFTGDWVGNWWQEGNLSHWRQHWHGLEALGNADGVWVQPVMINKRGAREPTVAMNAMVRSKGLMMGVVGHDQGRGLRPHVGVDLGLGKVGWIAREISHQGITRYSIFVEWLEAGCYMIKGVDFRWEPKTQMLLTVRPKGGLYTRLNPKSRPCASFPW